MTQTNELKQPTVLVVDDTPANIDVLVAHLTQENLELIVALSGEEGLSLAQQHKPDLILLDIMMPGMDGYEVCRRLKQDAATTDIPIVFLSARDSELDMEKGLSYGAIDYISKPFSIPVLKARLRNHLALKQKGDRLAELAGTDELTSLVNRRHFNQVFRQEWMRAIRNQSELSLLMIDVDYFKAYNDSLGHAEGDNCLKKIAQALLQGLRDPADIVARFGGEEFVVLLPDTDSAGAARVAERLRTLVQNLKLPHPGSANGGLVSISLGGATCIPNHHLTELGLLQQADTQLYKAKEGGRNRVCLEMAAKSQ
ncbi:diguanylate cyclase domain-containing protein [Bowmanella dokdonensis]|uniref:diguanylate cyclase n=1 Tax=Bowmanella dokdonensis TaxID=751969 RepID=A0A939DJE7_9ALTE|nr:diguanylate cyclase [Bowmanella dokdonensis]MBN7823747.1 diguanylate cyclase [Bowmanella dokdonensis]